MKSLLPILALFALFGLAFYAPVAGKPCKLTKVRFMRCAPDDIVPAVEAALIESGFRVLEAQTHRGGGVEGRIAAEDAAGTKVCLVLGQLPAGRVQVTADFESKHDYLMDPVQHRVEIALEKLNGSRSPR